MISWNNHQGQWPWSRASRCIIRVTCKKTSSWEHFKRAFFTRLLWNHFCFLFLTWEHYASIVDFLVLRIWSRCCLGEIFILRCPLQGWGRWYNPQTTNTLAASPFLPITRHWGFFWKPKKEQDMEVTFINWQTSLKYLVRDEAEANNVNKIWKLTGDTSVEIRGPFTDTVTIITVTDITLLTNTYSTYICQALL